MRISGYAFVYKAEDVKTGNGTIVSVEVCVQHICFVSGKGQQFAVKRVICGDEVSRKTAEKVLVLQFS